LVNTVISVLGKWAFSIVGQSMWSSLHMTFKRWVKPLCSRAALRPTCSQFSIQLLTLDVYSWRIFLRCYAASYWLQPLHGAL